MIKINYKKPEESESRDDIAMYNMKISDKYKKADYLEISCISWLKLDSNRDYQDLEQIFRYLDLDSYLIAQPISNIPVGLEINYPNNHLIEEPLEYIVKISCKPKEDSMKELLNYHSTYEENFECLKKTGCLMAKKSDNINKEEEEKISQIEGVDEVKQLLESKLKLDLTLYKPIESINYIIEDLTKKYGKKPDQITCGEINGNKVYALSIDNEIISPIGWIEKTISITNQLKLELDNELEPTNLPNPNNLMNDLINSNNKLSIDYELIDFRKIKLEKS